MFFASPDRRGERPLAHRAAFCGVLVADGYAGFNGLYEATRAGGALTEARCWAHVRRKIIDVHGGRISAENRPGGGAVFRIQLPQRPSGDSQLDSSF